MSTRGRNNYNGEGKKIVGLGRIVVFKYLWNNLSNMKKSKEPVQVVKIEGDS
jgi:hypothetical protein